MEYVVVTQDPQVPGGFLFKTGTINGNGDNVVIAQPNVPQRLVITALQVQNESATPVTIIVKAGGSPFWRTLAQNQGDGVCLPLVPGRGISLGFDQAQNGNALIINLSTGVQVGYSLQYYWTS